MRKGQKKSKKKVATGAAVPAEPGFESTVRELYSAGSPSFNANLFVVANMNEALAFIPIAVKAGKISVDLILDNFPKLKDLKGQKGVDTAIALFRFIEDNAEKWGVDVDYGDTPSTDSTASSDKPDVPDTDPAPKSGRGRKKGTRNKVKKAGQKVDKRRQGSVAEKVIQRFGEGDEKTALANLEIALSQAGSPAKLAKLINAKPWGFQVSAANLYFITKRLRQKYPKKSSK